MTPQYGPTAAVWSLVRFYECIDRREWGIEGKRGRRPKAWQKEVNSGRPFFV